MQLFRYIGIFCVAFSGLPDFFMRFFRYIGKGAQLGACRGGRVVGGVSSGWRDDCPALNKDRQLPQK